MSIIDVAMNLGSILLASAEADLLKRNSKLDETAMWMNIPTQELIGNGEVLADLIGEEHACPGSQPQVGISTFTDGHVRQAVMVILVGYWKMNCWNSRDEGTPLSVSNTTLLNGVSCLHIAITCGR